MKYYRNLVDYETGEVHRKFIGEHFTITELANKLGVARSNIVKLLEYFNVVWKEYDDKARQYRWRLRPEAVEKGLGYRIEKSESGAPFDVLSPDGVALVKDHLPAFIECLSKDRKVREARQALDEFQGYRLKELDTEGKVRWLLDHFPDLTDQQVAEVVGVSQPLVSRYHSKRNDQIERAKKLKAWTPDSNGFPGVDPMFDPFDDDRSVGLSVG